MVGKIVAYNIYVHRDYVHTLPTGWQQAIKEALEALPGFERYTYIKFDQKTWNVTFSWCPGWDTENEPAIRGQVLVKREDKLVKLIESNPDNPFIIHGKHFFVGEDYTGFDYREAERRYESYCRNKRLDKARMGRLLFWREFLKQEGMV